MSTTTRLEGAPFVVGYGTNGFGDHPLDDALDVLDALGYRALALTLGHPHLDPFADDARDRARELRLRLDDMGWRVVIETGGRYTLDPFRKHRPNLLDPDGAARVELLERAIDLAGVLRADAVSFWSGTLPRGTETDEALDRLVTRVGGLAATAASAGVALALEPEPGMLVETVADALAVRAAAGDPAALRLTVDLGHCVAVEPGGVVGALGEAGGLLANVQVDDMRSGVHEHLEFGDGELDLSAALGTLSAAGYTGIAAVELPGTATTRPAPQPAASEPSGPPGRQHERLVPHRTRRRGDRARAHRRVLAGVRAHGGPRRTRPRARPRGLRLGTVDDEARAALLRTAVASASPDRGAAIVRDLYDHGDTAERRGVLRGLNTLDEPTPPVVAAGLAAVHESLRANDPGLVAAAMGPFGADHLDPHAWRHGVLKLLFMGVPIDAVDALDARSDDELVRMATALVAERRSAGREVSADMLRVAGAAPSAPPQTTIREDAR
ncbi:EboA domain-containing protein [Agromyces mangrovi Wang et al. 2018]|uniref:EboA domain-containing protein n=1 Tax=Agromyces mangrovi TaxID=1858653 RepID=UPI00257400DF|nr:EboA domain-containing protein [Agromyces mangrovi]BDZ65231.1 hypothetical protein GCM10025877_21690 [Agromyces mangrovi]